MSRKNFKILLSATLFIIIVLPPASAYLDPGFGSMVWQMIAALVFAAAFTVKIYWQKLKYFFTGPKMNEPKE